MDTYIGVKLIKAAPQTKDGKEGYKVRYEDDYESWSSKEAFEKAYFLIENEDRLSERDIVNFIYMSTKNISTVDERTTLTKFTLPTGWIEYHSSSCIDKKNYNQVTGYNCCKEAMTNNLWKYLGFILQWAKHGIKRNS